MLPLPWIPEDLHASLDRLAAQYGLYPRPGKCIAVYGVVDGGGAAHIAANLAYEIAETWHQSTILAEPASSIGVLAELFDLSPAQTTEDLYHTGIPTRDKVRQTAARVTDRLLLLAGPRYKFPADPPAPEHVHAAIEALRRSADVVVIALPSNFDPIIAEILQQADDSVLVATQQIPSLHALREVQEALINRPHGAAIHLVVNCYSADREEFTAERLKALLKVEELWTIAEDPNVYQKAVNDGRPFREVDSDARCVADLVKLGTRILGHPPESNRRPSGYDWAILAHSWAKKFSRRRKLLVRNGTRVS